MIQKLQLLREVSARYLVPCGLLRSRLRIGVLNDSQCLHLGVKMTLMDGFRSFVPPWSQITILCIAMWLLSVWCTPPIVINLWSTILMRAWMSSGLSHSSTCSLNSCQLIYLHILLLFISVFFFSISLFSFQWRIFVGLDGICTWWLASLCC